MRTLQVDSRALEALGAPLGGSQVRAYVLSGGTPRFKNWKIKLSSQRCFLIFPVKGSERKGLVSVAVKKKNGKVRSFFRLYLFNMYCFLGFIGNTEI